jgi:hypothetical protein
MLRTGSATLMSPNISSISRDLGAGIRLDTVNAGVVKVRGVGRKGLLYIDQPTRQSATRTVGSVPGADRSGATRADILFWGNILADRCMVSRQNTSNSLKNRGMRIIGRILVGGVLACLLFALPLAAQAPYQRMEAATAVEAFRQARWPADDATIWWGAEARWRPVAWTGAVLANDIKNLPDLTTANGMIDFSQQLCTRETVGVSFTRLRLQKDEQSSQSQVWGSVTAQAAGSGIENKNCITNEQLNKDARAISRFSITPGGLLGQPNERTRLDLYSGVETKPVLSYERRWQFDVLKGYQWRLSDIKINGEWLSYERVVERGLCHGHMLYMTATGTGGGATCCNHMGFTVERPGGEGRFRFKGGFQTKRSCSNSDATEEAIKQQLFVATEWQLITGRDGAKLVDSAKPNAPGQLVGTPLAADVQGVWALVEIRILDHQADSFSRGGHFRDFRASEFTKDFDGKSLTVAFSGAVITYSTSCGPGTARIVDQRAAGFLALGTSHLLPCDDPMAQGFASFFRGNSQEQFIVSFANDGAEISLQRQGVYNRVTLVLRRTASAKN